MKRISRFLSLIVFAFLFLSLCSAAVAETPSLFIPDRLKALRLPDMPDIPAMPEAPALSCWMDLLEETPDCPKVADPDGDFHVQFDRRVDRCYVDGRELPIDENGYGEIPAEQTRMQRINIRAVLGNATYYYRTPGELQSAAARFDNLSVLYNEYGQATRMLLTTDTDYFRSGAEKCTAQINWESVILENQTTVGGKKKTVQTRVWYMNRLTVTYPSGSYIYRVVANYLNDKKNTLQQYQITYIDSPTDRYLITYSGKSYESGGIHYEEDQILKGRYGGSGPVRRLHRRPKDRPKTAGPGVRKRLRPVLRGQPVDQPEHQKSLPGQEGAAHADELYQPEGKITIGTVLCPRLSRGLFLCVFVAFFIVQCFRLCDQ